MVSCQVIDSSTWKPLQTLGFTAMTVIMKFHNKILLPLSCERQDSGVVFVRCSYQDKAKRTKQSQLASIRHTLHISVNLEIRENEPIGCSLRSHVLKKPVRTMHETCMLYFTLDISFGQKALCEVMHQHDGGRPGDHTRNACQGACIVVRDGTSSYLGRLLIDSQLVLTT